MNNPTSILGRGLACTLGVDLESCVDSLRYSLPQAQRVSLTPELSWPYFPINENPATAVEDDWTKRARRIVQQVVAECGSEVCRDAPLFIASSSLNVGTFEEGNPFPADGQTFIEEIAAWLDWRGPVFWMSSACTSSFNALLSARRLLDSGLYDQALVLGIELRNQFTSAGFSGMQLLAADTAKPLGRNRDGLVLGEAVGAILLGRKKARWRLRGGANQINGDNPVGADQQILTQTIALALKDAGCTSQEIDLIKLQAAGSPQNDAEEIAGLQAAFQAMPPLTTLKPSLGHTLGASGAAELVLLTACLEAGICPPSGNHDLDAELDARCSDAMPTARRNILANILGFGGGHCCLVLEDTAQA